LLFISIYDACISNLLVHNLSLYTQEGVAAKADTL